MTRSSRRRQELSGLMDKVRKSLSQQFKALSRLRMRETLETAGM